MRSPMLAYVKERARTSEAHGNRQSPFAEVRHFMGRLAYHVKAVRILLSAACRIPTLFLEPQIEVVPSPTEVLPEPTVRRKLNLHGITMRMISNDAVLLNEVRTRLQILNDSHKIEYFVQKEYGDKKFKPRVHAELILLEYFYQNRRTLRFAGDDPFIGTSKPTCYCCFLYFRAHPYHFVEPATHQKIYLNWMPPTSIPGLLGPNTALERHECKMLIEMVKSIRRRLIDQILSQSGRRQKHFDSTTGDNASAYGSGLFQPNNYLSTPRRAFRTFDISLSSRFNTMLISSPSRGRHAGQARRDRCCSGPSSPTVGDLG